MVFYGDNDKKLDMRVAGCSFPSASRSMTILSSDPSLVVIQTSGHPVDAIPNIDTNITGTVTYYILANGQIYIHSAISAVNAEDLSNGGTADLFIATMGLPDPTQTGTIPPDSHGWIRASATQNPYNYVGSQEDYVFAFWGPNTPNPYTNYTKASIMLVPSPNNPTSLGQIIHSWGCGTGCGVVRWGYRMRGPKMSAGQTIAYDFLMQLGTQGSSVLPNINSNAVAGPIANAYRANPTPPPVQPPPGIAPSVPPAVNQGATFKFTANVPVTWSMAPGSQGTIDGDGTYHAPASVKAQQSYGGYQVLPNNHIFNTRIDSLPVDPNSATWIAGAGTVPVNYLPSFPVNYVDASTPTQNMVFLYTPGNNGSFKLPQYPDAKIEGGWFTFGTGVDRHFFTIDSTNGIFQEMYNYYNAGQNSGCPTCTSQSGVRYANLSYTLPTNGATDAGGLYVMPLTLRLQEIEQALATGGTINHALRFTLQNAYIRCNTFIWPATTAACAGGGVVPYGARFRLKANVDISKFSPIAKILLTQLKQYGIILADGGYGWQITTEATKWPKVYHDAFSEIGTAGIGPSNFEAVDESGIEVSATSGLTTAGEVVVATSVASPSDSALMPVVLTGVTVGLPNDILYIQAGVGAQQFTAFVRGGTSNTVVWSMNPAVGTLTSGGLYTAPTTSSTIQTTTVTATSADDAAVAAQMTLVIYPNGTIRLAPGQATDYTDTHGNIWLHGIAGDGSYGYDNGGTWPSTPDITLYKIPIYGSGDLRFDIFMPNGSYQITGKFAQTQSANAGYRIESFESQGGVIYANVDVFVAAGGENMPVDFVLPATVTNGRLSFVLRAVGGSNVTTDISALQIAP
jgi:hypothetical protein